MSTPRTLAATFDTYSDIISLGTQASLSWKVVGSQAKFLVEKTVEGYVAFGIGSVWTMLTLLWLKRAQTTCPLSRTANWSDTKPRFVAKLRKTENLSIQQLQATVMLQMTPWWRWKSLETWQDQVKMVIRILSKEQIVSFSPTPRQKPLCNTIQQAAEEQLPLPSLLGQVRARARLPSWLNRPFAPFYLDFTWLSNLILSLLRL